MIAAIILANFTLHVVIGQHRMVQRHSRLCGMLTLSLILILIAKTVIVCTVLVVDAVDVDDALIAGARPPSDLNYALVRARLNRRLAQTLSKFLLLPFPAAVAAGVLRVLR